MKSKIPEITTGQMVPNRKKKESAWKDSFSFPYLACLHRQHFQSDQRAEGLNLMLINIYQSQNMTFIVVCLLPFTFSHSVWLLRQPLKYNA